MSTSRRLVSFDWALKRLLRSKANFEILEGFLSELLHYDITILEILESESNQETNSNKYNRVDLKVQDQHGNLLIIEVQYAQELDYLQRILYATSKVISEHMLQNSPYAQVIKVISVNILYFNLGIGVDYVYRGRTDFTGIHQQDQLQLSTAQQSTFAKQFPFEIFPEYYLLKINQFDDIARDKLDEWIYFLKNEEIKENFTAKGLTKAKEVLDMLKLSATERRQYESHQEDMRYKASMEFSSYTLGKLDGEREGIEKGIQKGLEKGREEERFAVASNLLPFLDDAAIAAATGLEIKTIAGLRT